MSAIPYIISDKTWKYVTVLKGHHEASVECRHFNLYPVASACQ